MTRWKCLALVCVAVLAGCSGAPPKCSDGEATDMVLQIVNQELESIRKAFIVMNRENTKITYEAALRNIRAIEKNEKTGSYRCAATVDIDSNSFMLKKSLNITYTTERTEDTKEVYVTVYGLKI